jgi:hypothetical protein
VQKNIWTIDELKETNDIFSLSLGEILRLRTARQRIYDFGVTILLKHILKVVGNEKEGG